MKPQGRTSTFRTSAGSQVVELKKTVHFAEMHGCPGTFTVTTFEPVDEKDQERFEEIAKNLLEAVMRWRSALLIQVFAVAESSALTLIVHDELANGDDFTAPHWEKGTIVYYYLEYTRSLAIQSLHNDKTTRFPVSRRWEDWSLNLKTLSWNYDLASIFLNPPSEQNLTPIFNPLPPLRQENPPQLNTTEIDTFIEETFGDVLYLIALGGTIWVTDLSRYARHGLLTFGAIVDRKKPKILAHSSSTPSPEWYFRSHNSNGKASYCRSGRVDLSFSKTGNIQLDLEFGLRIPANNCNQLWCAYLSQSLPLCENSNVRDVVHIDHVGFDLKGTFLNDSTTSKPPAFLFVPSLHAELTNNLYCLHYPFPQRLFYWAHDPQGRNVIAKEDWNKLGIPELRVEEWIGTYWLEWRYKFIQDHLCSKNYNQDGRQYAHEHGYPALIFADPHDVSRIEGVEDSEPELKDTDVDSGISSSPSQLASPSLSLLVEVPTEDTLTLPK
ncbi:hypothetical protein PQX77_019319 [Marasmius sp. AFHP31]|nr:hypothetical protein PQX77_019319 [Marasmius sp. AFHP31]